MDSQISLAQGMVPKLLELLQPPETGDGDAITVMVSEKPARPDRDGEASPVLSPKSHGSPMSRTVTWITWNCGEVQNSEWSTILCLPRNFQAGLFIFGPNEKGVMVVMRAANITTYQNLPFAVKFWSFNTVCVASPAQVSAGQDGLQTA